VGNRTPDLVIANDALYQLSYSPGRNKVQGPCGGAVSRIRGHKSTLPALCSASNCEARNYLGQIMVSAIFWLAGEIIHLLILAIIAAAVMSMLISFGIVDSRNRVVYSIADFLNRLTDPILAPIRRFLPNFGNVDISPIIAILLLEALQMVLVDVYNHLVIAGWAF
jgi:YggT family protein